MSPDNSSLWVTNVYGDIWEYSAPITPANLSGVWTEQYNAGPDPVYPATSVGGGLSGSAVAAILETVDYVECLEDVEWVTSESGWSAFASYPCFDSMSVGIDGTVWGILNTNGGNIYEYY